MEGEPPDFADVYDSDGDDRNPLIRIYVEYGGDHLHLFAIAIVATVLASLVLLVPPYLLGVALDAVTGGAEAYSLLLVPDAWLPTTRRVQFLLTLGLLFAAAVLASALHSINFITWAWFREHVKHDLRTDVYEATLHHGVEFFEHSQTGDVMSVLNNDVNELDNLFRHWAKNIIRASAALLGMTVLMIVLNWHLALFTIAVSLPALGTSYFFNDRIAPQHAEVRSLVGKLNARIQNSIDGVVTVKAYTNEDHERGRVTESSRAHRDAAWSVSKLQALYLPGMRLFTQFASVLVFVVGGWWAVFGPPVDVLLPLSIGTFVTFYLYSQQFAGRVGGLNRFVDQYNDILASAERVFGLLAYPTTVSEAPDAIDLHGVDGRVEYDDVTFRYPGADDDALGNVSFDVEPGSLVGVVGPSGAGKTTLLKLLLRFYDPDSGTVRVDGVDLRDVTLDSLRESVGYVSQEPFLFDDSVRENLAYADPSASDADVTEAARRANAHEFIQDLPQGYETQIGERGVKLSGGQRQRLAIARAILMDPEILILDEATSHVDNETELLIQESLADLVADRTTFAIAHSLSTVRDADTILVLEDGELVETGSHTELLDQEGVYATLWGIHVGENDSLPSAVTDGGPDDV